MQNNSIFSITFLLAIACVSLTCFCLYLNSERTRLAGELQNVQSESEYLKAEIERARLETDNASKRFDEALQTITKGFEYANQNNQNRLDALQNISLHGPDNARDWLLNPVPDDIARLFNDASFPMCESN